MTAAELLAIVAALPPETELGSVSFGGSGASEARHDASREALRARAYRARKRDGVTTRHDGGLGGFSLRSGSNLSDQKAEKQGKEADPEEKKEATGKRVRASESVTTVTTRHDGQMAGKPWRRVPTSWEPNDGHWAIARERGVDLGRAVADFRDHEFAKPKRDADATFRKWLRSPFQAAQASGVRRTGPGGAFLGRTNTMMLGRIEAAKARDRANGAHETPGLGIPGLFGRTSKGTGE